jgi:hypothetical protein
MGDAQNCAENHRICAESDLGPDFIGTLVPTFGSGYLTPFMTVCLKPR